MIFGHLLLSVVLSVDDLQPEHVTVEANRRLHIGDGNADMIKTEQTRKHNGEIGGLSGHAH